MSSVKDRTLKGENAFFVDLGCDPEVVSSRYSSLLWLRGGPQVHLAGRHLVHLDTLGEETSSIFLLHSRNHHAAPTSLPVNRRGHLAGGGELEAVNHSEDFVEVSSCGGWVQERQLQPLVRANDEHRPAGEGNALGIFLIRVHHSVQSGHLSFGISNDGIRETSLEVVVGNDVLDPAIVAVHLVTAQGDQLHSTLCEIIAQHLHPAQLSGTHWGVVSRVREEDSPAVLDPAVEVNVSLSCV